jgi:hypothetical protein
MIRISKNIWIEMTGVAIVLASFSYMLVSRYSIMAWSDPIHWYSFGMSFANSFGRSSLAYGFPLILSLAEKLVGPFYAFLVNIPILTILLLAFYLFSRSLKSNDKFLVSPIFAAFSLLFIVLLNRDMFVYLANPYRDPKSLGTHP